VSLFENENAIRLAGWRCFLVFQKIELASKASFLSFVLTPSDVRCGKGAFMFGKVVLLGVVLLGISSASLPAFCDSRVQLTMDSSEADQILSILALRHDGKPVEDGHWQKLFATEPYRRLKQREQKIAEQVHDPKVAFSDENFKKFVLSDDLQTHSAQLRRTLDQWKKADIQPLAERDLLYLPPQAEIHAKVYPVIKPNPNSFVWEASSNPAIFLYLNPEISRQKFENKVAHELHHIGLESAQAEYAKKIAALSERPHAVAEWLGAFGEGFAMLAAAGSPDIDPQATSSPEDQARWKHDLENFASDLQSVNDFFVDVLKGKYANRDAIDEKAGDFFGTQGP
jgi:hypothetical protein